MTVYFIREGERGPVKIGYTSGPIEARLACLRIGTSGELRLLTTIRGDIGDEARLHRDLAEHRIRGEWFHPHEKVFARMRLEQIRDRATDPRAFAGADDELVARLEQARQDVAYLLTLVDAKPDSGGAS